VTRPIRLMTLAPGHFHAALVQKEMLPELHPRAYVYGPLDADLVEHLARIAAFNHRPDNPTRWQLDVRAGGDYLARFLREQPGNAVVIAGRNRPKIDLILAAVSNACHVLADKPWVIDAAGFEKLAEVFRQADIRDVLTWDMMTERYDIATVLQRELIQDRDVFGDSVAGTPDDPALTLDSTHHLRKTVAGAPLRRPAWWFDPAEAGTGLADVGTHLAGLSIWLLFPDQVVDHRADLEMLDARIWPTPLDREQYRTLTGDPDFPPCQRTGDSPDDLLLYEGNGSATYRLRGLTVRYTVNWDYEAAGPGRHDLHEATARGSRARIRVQTVATPEGRAATELSVIADGADDHADLFAAVGRRCGEWQLRYPGLKPVDLGDRIRIHIPDRYRTDHEQHFADVLDEFLRHARNPRRAPLWEAPNLLTKYAITTQALEWARAKQGRR